ncbi:MAG TPA: hypothetical protein VFP40_09030 [Terriglobales bacterium]|nr:hypothetical protein [Terriglobales bacterium]
MARQPIRDGWRVLRRAPAVVPGEIAWRWTFGITSAVLIIISFHTYLSSIEISRAEYETLKAFEPFTWMAITVRLLHAIAEGTRVMGPVLFPSLALLWIGLATVGRVITVRALSAEKAHPNWMASLLLHVLRVIAVLAAVLAYLGAGILISRTIDPKAHFGASFTLSLFSMLAVASIWGALNWLLSVAAIFTSKDGAGVRESLSEGVALFATGKGAINLWFALMRTAALIAISYFSFFLVPFLLSGNWLAPAIVIVVLSMAYFAFADFLYIWRLAAYIGLTEPEPEVEEAPPPPQLLAPEQVLIENSQPPSVADPGAPMETGWEGVKADS